MAGLVSGLSQEQAAASVGVSARTLRRWQADLTFRKAAQDAQTEATGLMVARLHALGSRAVDVLAVALTAAARKGADAERSTRIACAVLDRLSKWHEAHELEDRLAEVERRLAALGGMVQK